jgi:hypothetical protein
MIKGKGQQSAKEETWTIFGSECSQILLAYTSGRCLGSGEGRMIKSGLLYGYATEERG